MTKIPPGTKFHGVAPSVDTTDSGSSNVQILRDAYAIEDFGSTLSVSTTLSSAEVLSLDTTPVEVVPAQGVGKKLLVLSAWMKLFFNSVPFDYPLGTQLNITPLPFSYANGQAGFVSDNSQGISQSYNSWSLVNVGTLNVWLSPPLVDNGPLYLYSFESATVGDSTVEITVEYKIVE